MTKKSYVSPKTVFTDPVHFLAFGFGSGLSPVAPGTFGTIAAAIIYYFYFSQLSFALFVGVIILTFALGVYLCGASSKKIGVNDHSGIVWDEFVGFWITMLLAPAGLAWLVAGFILFRFFDILKPWPINYFDQKFHSGLGIMLDDVIAGLYSFLCIQLAVPFLAS